jgi:hypothetical protein
MNVWNDIKFEQFYVKRRTQCECKDDCGRLAEHGHHGLASRTSKRKFKKVVDKEINMQMLNSACHANTTENTIFFLQCQILRHGKDDVVEYLESVRDVGYQTHRMKWLLRETEAFE